MKKLKFNANEVRCTCIGGKGYRAAIKHNEIIQSIVEEVISKIGREHLYELVKSLNNVKRDLHPGNRFCSNKNITNRLASGLGNYVYSSFENDELVEIYLETQLKKLSYEEKEVLVVEAARDAASADHWYTFEKQWDD